MLKVFNRSATAGPLAVVEALQAELQVLREENARLRMLRHREGAMPAAERLSAVVVEAEQVLALQRVADAAADAADEAWQTLASALVLRDALVGVCDELVVVATRLRERLAGLAAWPDGTPVASPPVAASAGPTGGAHATAPSAGDVLADGALVDAGPAGAGRAAVDAGADAGAPAGLADRA